MVLKSIPEPRYEKSTTAAYQFLMDMKVSNFPIDLFHIAELYDVSVVPYSELLSDPSVPPEETERLRRMLTYSCQDGFTRCIDHEYVIFYNDAVIEKRIRFTLAHELGHIVLEHFEDFLEETSLIPTERALYQTLEFEANSFARNLLAPFHFATSVLAEDPFESAIGTTFHLSRAASAKRILFLQEDISNLHPSVNDEFIKMYARRLSAPLYGKCCSKCNNFIVGSSVCKICQTGVPPEYLMKRGFIMMYSQIEVRENGMPYTCPNCHNERLEHDGPHCQVCGWNIINQCSDNQYCGQTPLEGDARYCSTCGSNSVYFNNGYLPNWELENPELASNRMRDQIPF